MSKFKVGDKVKVRPLEWFKENCDDEGCGWFNIDEAPDYFTPEMYHLCDKEFEVEKGGRYDIYLVGQDEFVFNDWMFEPIND